MKTFLIYAGLFGLGLYWLNRNRRHPTGGEVEAEMQEQRTLQRVGQIRTNAEIFNTVPIYDPWFTVATNPEIFTPQTPINRHENATRDSIFGLPVLPRRFGTSTIITLT